MKKVFSLLLAVLMLVSALPVTYAAETQDYSQGTAVVYTADDETNENWTVTVPAKLAPGTGGTVTLDGYWPSTKTITVTAQESVKLTNSINANDTKTLAVDFRNGISAAGSNTEKQTFTETVSVEAITNALFGTWDGHFYYTVGSAAVPVLEGDGQTFYTMAPTTLSFRSTAPMDEFQEVQINGVTVDPSNYTLTEGSTIVTLSIDYLKTLDVTAHEITVVSDSGSPSAGFSVVEPELSTHGFYYNQPYNSGDGLVLVLHQGGSGDVIAVFDNGSATIDDTIALTYTSGSDIILSFEEEYITGAVSADGMEIYFSDWDITCKLDELTMADDDYIYVYSDSLSGYVVSAIDKTKSSYGAILTGVNNRPTVGLSDNAFWIPANGEGAGLATIIIPDSVTYIGDEAFAACYNLTSVTFGTNSQLTSIGKSAFFGCTNLSNFIIPQSVTSIDLGAFEGCASLASINIPSGVTIIRPSTFSKCTSLTSVVIPAGVTTIGAGAFRNCTSLTSITFEGTVAQWNAITKNGESDAAWNYNVPATEVICSDGTVALS